jgi:short-subunit dehydrogenase
LLFNSRWIDVAKMARELSDMVVVITGASAGIGRTLAASLSTGGAKLVLAARRMDLLETLNASLGGKHLCVKADVSREEDCHALIESAVDRFGRLDTLVCNAGYGILRPVYETSAKEMQDIFQTNVFGTADCIRAAVPILRRQEIRNGWRGQIIIVSSAAGRRGIPFFGAYSATKFAQLGLAEALRIELRPARIAVTSVHPIGTKTDFFTTAESASNIKMPPNNEFRQTAATVARKMIAAIRRPKPEVWPLGISRLGLGFAALMPRLTDHFVAKFSRELVEGSAARGAEVEIRTETRAGSQPV